MDERTSGATKELGAMDDAQRRRGYSALALLLCYPAEEWLSSLPDVSQAAQALFGAAPHPGIAGLVDYLSSRPLSELQESYVACFDRSLRGSLHLFEHTHGDAAQRGAAMARLGALYAEAGWELSEGELPDYLPALCEFLGLAGQRLARALLDESHGVLQQLHEHLAGRPSPYAGLLQALLDLYAQMAGLDDAQRSTLVRGSADSPMAAPAAGEDLVALDEQWAEVPVSFSPGAAHDSVLPASRLLRGHRANSG